MSTWYALITNKTGRNVKHLVFKAVLKPNEYKKNLTDMVISRLGGIRDLHYSFDPSWYTISQQHVRQESGLLKSVERPVVISHDTVSFIGPTIIQEARDSFPVLRGVSPSIECVALGQGLAGFLHELDSVVTNDDYSYVINQLIEVEISRE